MAVFNFENAMLKITYETGVDQLGNPIITSKTYRNVRAGVQPTQVAAVVQAIANLSKYPLKDATKTLTETVVF